MSEAILDPRLIVLGLCSLHGLSSEITAMSDEAGAIADNATSISKALEESEALFGAKCSALDALREIAIECRSDDWDSYGATAVSETALMMTERLIRTLPDDVALPEISPEPDGELSLDWTPSDTRTFSLSIGNGRRFSYAWIDGTDRGHGVASIVGNNLPTRLLRDVRDFAANESFVRAV